MVDQVADASVAAIQIWWDVLFPALMPFLIVAELWAAFGVVAFLGTMLDPWMRPLFRVPGCGAVVWVVGFASGYPVAAKLCAELVLAGELTRVEAERLTAFATTADPMFIATAVAMGMLGAPKLASLLVASHFAAALLVGVVYRYYRRHEPGTPAAGRVGQNRLREAFANMHRVRMAESRTFARVLFDAAERSLELVLVIGGIGMALLPIPERFSGLFEVTLGAKALATSVPDPHLLVTAVSAALAWGGLSVHVQVIGLGSSFQLRYVPFVVARFLHSCFAAGLAWLLWR
jgi:sporulation integral membrane protein YlbJ